MPHRVHGGTTCACWTPALDLDAHRAEIKFELRKDALLEFVRVGLEGKVGSTRRTSAKWMATQMGSSGSRFCDSFVYNRKDFVFTLRAGFLPTGHGLMNAFLQVRTLSNTTACSCGQMREDWLHYVNANSTTTGETLMPLESLVNREDGWMHAKNTVPNSRGMHDNVECGAESTHRGWLSWDWLMEKLFLRSKRKYCRQIRSSYSVSYTGLPAMVYQRTIHIEPADGFTVLSSQRIFWRPFAVCWRE